MSTRSRREEDKDAPFTLADEGPGLRAQRLEHLLFEELDRLFRLEVSDPRLAAVVPTSVQMSPDLRNAKIYYAIRPPKKRPPPAPTQRAARVKEQKKQREVDEGLERVTPFLRARLADAVQLRRLPELHFHRDRIAEAALR